MADKQPAVPIPADAITIYHPKHGESHCHKDQLKDMESEGWSREKEKPKK